MIYFKGLKGVYKITKIGFKNPIYAILTTILLIMVIITTTIIIALKTDLNINFNLLQKGAKIDFIKNIGVNIVNLIIPIVNIIVVWVLKFIPFLIFNCIICVIGFFEKRAETSIYNKFIEMRFLGYNQQAPKILGWTKNKSQMILKIKSSMTIHDMESFKERLNHFFDMKVYKIKSLGNMKVEIIFLSHEEFKNKNTKEIINFKDMELKFSTRLKGIFTFLNLNISNIKVEENFLFTNIYFNSNEKISYLKNMEVEIIHRLHQIITIETSDISMYDYKITLRKNKKLSYLTSLKSVMGDMDKMDIPFLLGADTKGQIKVVDYRTKYHTIIGGTTGSGKTNYIHSMLCGLLYSNKNITYTILDIKKDMNMYKNIDNVVYSDDTQVIKSILENLVMEMEYRNELTSKMGFTKDIEKYNKHVENPLPYVMVIIDEVADLLMSYGTKESEGIQKLIQRLVQRSRSAGFRILLTTQKPTVDVINGIIKGNCSNRMGFMVDNANDSRIILDDSRASTITSIGEFYFKSDNRFTLYKGVFISDQEHEEILNYVMKHFKIA